MSDCKHEQNDVSPDGAMERCKACGAIRWARVVEKGEWIRVPLEWMRELNVEPTIEERAFIEQFGDTTRVVGTFQIRKDLPGMPEIVDGIESVSRAVMEHVLYAREGRAAAALIGFLLGDDDELTLPSCTHEGAPLMPIQRRDDLGLRLLLGPLARCFVCGETVDPVLVERLHPWNGAARR